MNEEIRLRVLEGLGIETAEIIDIKAGNNNRLFLVQTLNDRYLVKVYFKDERNRLQREFTAFDFLRKNGFQNVPKVYFKNEGLNFAVYSFQEGRVISSLAAGKEQIDSLLDFIIELYKFNYSDVLDKFEPAVMACFELQDYLKNIQFRFNRFKEYKSSQSIHPLVGEFINQVKVIDYIESEFNRLEDKVLSSTHKSISEFEKKLSPVDFGLHNALFKIDDSVCFVDFEYFGWDDPARIIADFVNHDMQFDLPTVFKQYFVEEYIKRADLAETETERLYLVKELISLEWLTIYLYGMTPEKIATRLHANPDYNLEESLLSQIRKIKQRYFALEN